jgi:hypothetical protein
MERNHCGAIRQTVALPNQVEGNRRKLGGERRLSVMLGPLVEDSQSVLYRVRAAGRCEPCCDGYDRSLG